MRMSLSANTSHDLLARAQPHLFFPCGVIRGVLASLGIKATVQAESTELPGAVFQIKTALASKG
jgi:trafficking protein particle complex subunit 6